MVTAKFDARFEQCMRRLRDSETKKRVWNLVRKVIRNPEVGKPMRFWRKGTREVYLPPFRLSYVYIESDDVVVFLELYHKDEQ